jgi:diaminopimelate epimerase
MSDTLHLTKHHGLGNDFLILVDLDGDHPVDAATARRLCDRRLGVGADGLIRVSPPPGDERADVAMTLHNADGSLAEMSGNGIRCLGQAVARARRLDTLDLAVATTAGVRRLEVGPGPAGDPTTAWVEVDMGSARPGPTGWEANVDISVAIEALALKATTLDMGNPHLVLLVDDPATVDLAILGPAAQAGFAQGVNVEVIAPTPGRPDQLDLVVWERGVGPTLACGTGACAAAQAAYEWGLVGERVQVRMPGGEVTVTLGDQLRLAGPATFVAEVEVAT